MDTERQRVAAATLEELEPVLKEIVDQLRMGVADGLAYALVYQFRRDLGRVVAALGGGSPRTEHVKQAEDIIESQKWQPRT